MGDILKNSGIVRGRSNQYGNTLQARRRCLAPAWGMRHIFVTCSCLFSPSTATRCRRGAADGPALKLLHVSHANFTSFTCTQGKRTNVLGTRILALTCMSFMIIVAFCRNT